MVTVWTLLGLLTGACRGGPLEPGDALGTVRLTATGAVSVSGPGFATVHLLPPWAVRGSVHFTATEAGGAGTVSVEAVFNASCTPGMACQ